MATLSVLDAFELLPEFVGEPLQDLGKALLVRSGEMRTSPIPATILIPRSDAAGADDPAAREPSVEAFDRRALAQALDRIGELDASPRLVIVDVDVSPEAPADDEAELRAALQRWNDAPSRPLLVLVRFEACGEPRGRAMTRRWRATPYDGLIAPTTGSPSRILWACIAPDSAMFGGESFYHGYGCSRPGPGGLAPALPSPGIVARWLYTAPERGGSPNTAGALFKAHGPQLEAACFAGKPSDPALQSSLPAAYSPRFRTLDLAQFLQHGKALEAEWEDATVIVGAADARSRDVHVHLNGKRIWGVALLGSYVNTAAGYAPGWGGISVVLLQTAIIGVMVVAFLLYAAARTRAERGIRRRYVRVALAFLIGPGRASAATAAGLVWLLGPFLALELRGDVWRAVAYAIAGGLFALELMDAFVNEAQREDREPQENPAP